MGGSVQFRKQSQEQSGAKKPSRENYKPVDKHGYLKKDNLTEDILLNHAKNNSRQVYYPPEVHRDVRKSETQSVSILLDNNAKPTVVSTEVFNHLKEESGAIVLSRSTMSDSSIRDYVDNNFTIQPAGRWDGSAYGEGIYFDRTDGPTGYGDHTLTCVLSKKAKIITSEEINEMRHTRNYVSADGKRVFIKDYHDEGALALALGYDVISTESDGWGYYVVLNRSATITDGKINVGWD